MACNDTLEICINQNASFTLTFQLTASGSGTPIDITNWEFSGSLKDQYKSTAPIVAEFSTSIVDLSTATVNATLTPTQTNELTKTKYVYDIIASVSGSSPAETVRLLEGIANVAPGVTVES